MEGLWLESSSQSLPILPASAPTAGSSGRWLRPKFVPNSRGTGTLVVTLRGPSAPTLWGVVGHEQRANSQCSVCVPTELRRTQHALDTGAMTPNPNILTREAPGRVGEQNRLSVSAVSHAFHTQSFRVCVGNVSRENGGSLVGVFFPEPSDSSCIRSNRR